MSKETQDQLKKIESIDTSKIVAEVEEKAQQDEIIILTDGHRVKFRSVAPDLIRKVRSKIEDPEVPSVPHPDDPERVIANPNHPDYIQAVKDVKQKRTDAVVKAIMLRGVILLDGLPEDEEWIEDLIFLGILNEEEVKGAGKKLKEIWYKQYIVLDTSGYELLQEKIGLNEEMVAQARQMFQRDKARISD